MLQILTVRLRRSSKAFGLTSASRIVIQRNRRSRSTYSCAAPVTCCGKEQSATIDQELLASLGAGEGNRSRSVVLIPSAGAALQLLAALGAGEGNRSRSVVLIPSAAGAALQLLAALGAGEGNRTPDLLITSEPLCRLSYPGAVSRRQGLTTPLTARRGVNPNGLHLRRRPPAPRAEGHRPTAEQYQLGGGAPNDFAPNDFASSAARNRRSSVSDGTPRERDNASTSPARRETTLVR